MSLARSDLSSERSAWQRNSSLFLSAKSKPAKPSHRCLRHYPLQRNDMVADAVLANDKFQMPSGKVAPGAGPVQLPSVVREQVPRAVKKCISSTELESYSRETDMSQSDVSEK